MTTKTTTTVDTVLAAVAEAHPTAGVIRNAPDFGHIIRPRRRRAAFMVHVHADADLVNVVAFDGRGYVIDTIVGTTDVALAYIADGL